jgi:DHA2 family multidrug resistance protein
VSSQLSENATPDNLNVAAGAAGALDLNTAVGQAAMSGMIERQSALVAYIDTFHMLFIMCVVILPLLLFLRVKRASMRDIKTLILPSARLRC